MECAVRVVSGDSTRVLSYVAMISIFGIGSVLLLPAIGMSANNARSFVNAKTALEVPKADYRKQWAHLGTYSVLADEPSEGAEELHIVYTERKNLEVFLNSGRFPDGAVLVKDVITAKTETLTTGIASYAGELAGRFIMVKDASNKHVGTSPLWGDGWGWAFYEGSETKRTVTSDYKTDCLGCHEPARRQDLLFLQGYPILRK